MKSVEKCARSIFVLLLVLALVSFSGYLSLLFPFTTVVYKFGSIAGLWFELSA